MPVLLGGFRLPLDDRLGCVEPRRCSSRAGTRRTVVPGWNSSRRSRSGCGGGDGCRGGVVLWVGGVVLGVMFR